MPTTPSFKRDSVEIWRYASWQQKVLISVANDISGHFIERCEQQQQKSSLWLRIFLWEQDKRHRTQASRDSLCIVYKVAKHTASGCGGKGWFLYLRVVLCWRQLRWIVPHWKHCTRCIRTQWSKLPSHCLSHDSVGQQQSFACCGNSASSSTFKTWQNRSYNLYTPTNTWIWLSLK